MAFVATAKPAAARSFYESLGLRLISDDAHAVVFDLNGTMLRVQKLKEWTPPRHTALGWQVTDLAAVMADLRGRGVAFEHYGLPGQDDQGVWHIPDGTKVAWFRDPDGNILSLTQL